MPEVGAHDLTICSVSYRSRPLMHLNWQALHRANAGVVIPWIVVENSEPSHSSCIEPDDERFIVIPGPVCNRTGEARASYHHALGLNRALGLVATRFVLFLDPDCFLVAADWIRNVLTHMQDRELTFFGTPYYPSRINKYRHFPCGICMFVDLSQVSREIIDFTPEGEELRATLSLSCLTLLRWLFAGRVPQGVRGVNGITLEMVRWALRSKLLSPLLGRYAYLHDVSRDTGYRVYRRFASQRRYRRECVRPVWQHPWLSRSASTGQRVKRFLTQSLLPDNFLTYPKSGQYCSTEGFAAHGLADLIARGWEEYLWRDQPFAFHIRGSVSPSTLQKVIDEVLTCTAERFAPRVTNTQ